MFNVQAVPAILSNLTAYSEKHGEDNVSGLALKLEMTLPSSILDALSPHLRPRFYRIDLKDMPLVFPELESISWKRDLIGARVSIGYDDLFNSAPVELTDTTVDKIRLALLSGGSVEVTVRIKTKPDAMSVGRLYEWLQKEVQLTIEPPTAEAANEPDDLVSRVEATTE